MVDYTANRSKSSVYGAQPRSLHLNWMIYNVTKENFDPNTTQTKTSKTELSPLRLRLKESGEKVLLKRGVLSAA